MSDEGDVPSLDPLNKVTSKCELCGKFVKNASKIQCNGCLAVVHPKCADSVAKICVINFENWLCKQCHTEDNSSNSDPELSQKNTNLSSDQQNGLLIKQVEILEKLVHELENVNRLQREKIATLEKTALPITTISSGPSTSYSAVVKNSPDKYVDIVVVKNNKKIGSSSNGDSTSILNSIQKNVDPVSLNVRIASTKMTNKGLIFKCADEHSSDTLLEKIKNSVGEDYIVEKSAKWNPRVIIKNVDMDHYNTDSDTLIASLISLNNLEVNSQKSIRIVTRLKYKSCFSIVLEINSIIRNKIIGFGKVFLGWRSYTIEDYIHVLCCYKCSKFGHNSSNCKNKEVICYKCAQAHDSRDCKSSSFKCQSCVVYNSKNKSSSVPFDHICGDRNKCTAFKNQLKYLTSKVDY